MSELFKIKNGVFADIKRQKNGNVRIVIIVPEEDCTLETEQMMRGLWREGLSFDLPFNDPQDGN